MNYEMSYSVPQAEKILGLDKSVIYKKIKSGELKHNNCRPIRIKKSYLCSYILERAPHAWHIWREEPVTWVSFQIKEKATSYKDK